MFLELLLSVILQPNTYSISNPYSGVIAVAEAREEVPPRIEPTLREAVFAIADKYNVPRETVDNLITGESNWEPDRVNELTGDYGLFQINIDSWDITKEQALNPLWSAEWSIKKLSEGKEHYWVVCNCYAYAKVVSGYKLPTMGLIEPNSYAFKGAIAIFSYKGIKHLGVIDGLEEDGFWVREANYKPCSTERRKVQYDDPAIRGFYDPDY